MPLAELKALTPPAVHRKLAAALKKGAAAAKRGEPSGPAALPSLAEQAAAAAAKKAKRRRPSPPPSLAGASAAAGGGPSAVGGPGKARSAAVTASAPPAPVARVFAGKEWSPGDAVSVGSFCSFVQAQEGYSGQLTYAAAEPPREARTVPLASASLSPPLEAALRARDVSALFCHQAAALQAQRAGQHVIVATGTSSGSRTLALTLSRTLSLALTLAPTLTLAGTSSGKSLAYMVPAIEAVLAKPAARAGSTLIAPCAHVEWLRGGRAMWHCQGDSRRAKAGR